nr:hypothetical protein [Candidatus Sigynarchaeota archaeon]
MEGKNEKEGKDESKRENKKISLSFGGKKEDKEKQDKASKPKSDTDLFDLITIVESVEMEIPEKRPPVEEILYDYIPESLQPITASKEDHVSRAEHGND